MTQTGTTIDVGVIGAGWAGRGHIRHYQEVPGVTVVGVADANGELAAKVAHDFEIERSYEDYRQLLDDPRLRVVSVTVPPFLHKEVVLAAADCGVQIHCEKPMCLTLEDADEMIAACKRNNVLLYISFLPRQMAAYRRVQEMVASGDCGEPIWMMDQRLLPAKPGLWMPPGWFWRRELGGGMLVENGGHHFDYIRWLMGEVTTVQAQAATLRFKDSWPPYFEHPNIEDTAMVTMRHANGTMSNLLNTLVVPSRGGMNLQVATTTHYLTVERTTTLVVERDGKIASRTTFEDDPQAIHSAHHIIACVRHGTPPNNTGEDGRAALELSLAALESSRIQQPITLPLPATPAGLMPRLQ